MKINKESESVMAMKAKSAQQPANMKESIMANWQ
jgi:hypothetical protein